MIFGMVIGSIIFFLGILIGMSIERVQRGDYDKT